MTDETILILAGIAYIVGAAVFLRFFVQYTARKWPGLPWTPHDTAAAIYFSTIWPMVLPLMLADGRKRRNTKPGLLARWHAAEKKRMHGDD